MDTFIFVQHQLGTNLNKGVTCHIGLATTAKDLANLTNC